MVPSQKSRGGSRHRIAPQNRPTPYAPVAAAEHARFATSDHIVDLYRDGVRKGMLYRNRGLITLNIYFV
jgi:hypothetical protein